MDAIHDSTRDEELAARAQEGHQRAFQALMERYIGRIFSFVMQYARDGDEAEDIAQDAFFKAWKHIGRFRRDARFRPWLYAIARNTALDHVKKKRAAAFSDIERPDE